MRSPSWLRRASALVLATAAITATSSDADGAELIPALQIDGRGFGHGVGMAQDGALAMGQAKASLAQILGQFYPGTNVGRASGPVRVPVHAGNNVEVAFPDGGEVRGNAGTLQFAPGASAIVSRDGQSIRVQPTAAAAPPTTAPPSPPATTTTMPPPAPAPTPTSTTSTTAPVFPISGRRQADPVVPTSTTSTTKPAPATTAPAPASPGLVYSGPVSAVPNGAGRVGVVPRGRRYRGTLELAPLAGGVRFVNQVNVETYLRGMGEVRNPNWPAASLQAQAVAARTYALRAMAAGGELCDTQRCQVYIGSDAEYAAMDRAVAATAGQVLYFGKSLASAVYSANGGGHSASREEGFGLGGPSSYPYLRAAPYLYPKPDAWTVTLALADVGRRLNYAGNLAAVVVAERGPSGRATRVTLQGDRGDVTVTGLAFDAALGLKSTLVSLTPTMAEQVSDIEGGSILQAPPEEAAALTTGQAEPPPPSTPKRADAAAVAPPSASAAASAFGTPGAVALVLWLAVVAAIILTRRRAATAWTADLS